MSNRLQGQSEEQATEKMHQDSGRHWLYCPAARTDGRQHQAAGSGRSLPGLVLQGKPLHPLLKLWPEVADQALEAGRRHGEAELKIPAP